MKYESSSNSSPPGCSCGRDAEYDHGCGDCRNDLRTPVRGELDGPMITDMSHWLNSQVNSALEMTKRLASVLYGDNVPAGECRCSVNSLLDEITDSVEMMGVVLNLLENINSKL